MSCFRIKRPICQLRRRANWVDVSRIAPFTRVNTLSFASRGTFLSVCAHQLIISSFKLFFLLLVSAFLTDLRGVLGLRARLRITVVHSSGVIGSPVFSAKPRATVAFGVVSPPRSLNNGDGGLLAATSLYERRSEKPRSGLLDLGVPGSVFTSSSVTEATVVFFRATTAVVVVRGRRV
ncbi:hypothetical protein CPC08DRAFT_251889 [Agrocybe pediades]|nr:hypothetical protein CPC08DRAFT_251889 [Agrocybe pediades]